MRALHLGGQQTVFMCSGADMTCALHAVASQATKVLSESRLTLPPMSIRQFERSTLMRMAYDCNCRCPRQSD